MKTSLAAIAALLCLSAPALADEALPPPAADSGDANADADADDGSRTIIVIGQQDAPVTVVPRGLSVSLGQENFDAVNAINVEDLMKYTPNFFVRKRFAGDDNAVVAMRGANTVQSARTIVMVDGFVVSNFLGNRYDFPPKWNVVGPAEVRQFDIVYGPYSARYGGNSMGGVISVTTKAPDETSFYANAQTMIMPFREYGFDQTFSGYSVESGLNWKQQDGPWSARLSARHFENTGQSMTYNLLTASTGAGTAVTGAYEDSRLATPVFGAASPVDVTQDQFRLRLGWDAGGWKLDALGMIWKTRQDLTDARSWLVNAATGAPVYQGKVSFGGRTWNATGLTLSITERTEYLAGIRATGDLAGWDVSANLSRFWIGRQAGRTSKDYASGIALGAGTISLARNPGWETATLSLERRLGGHALALGLDANRYHTDTETFTTGNWRTAAGRTFSAATYGKTSLWGLWAEDAIDLGADWVLTGGARYDRWRAFDGGIAKLYAGARKDDAYPVRHDDSLSPKLSLQGRLADRLTAQLSLGTATRFPTVGELFQGRFDDVTQAIDPQSFDPRLKPERSRDANLILRWDGGGPVRLTGSLFYQRIADAIFSFSGVNPFGTTVSSYKNVDRVEQYGLELIAEARDVAVPGLDLDANLAWISAKTVKNRANPAAEGVQFPRIPKWRANGNLRYRIADPLKASLGWRMASRPNSDLFGLQRGRAFGFQSEYVVFDARLSWTLAPGMELGAGVDNLFDYKAYVAHPLPQRTFVIDVKTKW